MIFSRFLHTYKVEVMIFLAAFLLRILLLSFFVTEGIGISAFPQIGSDSKYYLSAAESLLQNGRFVYSDNLQPNSYEMPGYPIFIAFFLTLFGSPLVISFIQNIIAGFSAVLLFRIGLFFSRPVAWGAALLFAFDPAGLFYSNFILTEPLFIFLALAAFYFAAIRWWTFWPGIIIGFATMVRPIGIVFLPPIIIFYFFYHAYSLKKAFFAGLLFVVGFAIIVGPWFLRNKIIFDRWELSSVLAWQLYHSHAPHFYAYQNNISPKEAEDLFHERLIAIDPLEEEARSGRVGSLWHAPYMWKVALDYIGEHPFRYAWFHAVKTIPFFLSDGLREIMRASGLALKSLPSISDRLLTGDFSGITADLKSDVTVLTLFLFGFATWLFINGFMVAGVFFGWREGGKVRAILMLAFLLVLLSAIAAGGAVSHPRYRFSVSPFMFLLASYGFCMLQEKIYKRRALNSIS